MNNNLEIYTLPTTTFKVSVLQAINDKCTAQKKKKEEKYAKLSPKQIKKIYKELVDYVQLYYHETTLGNYYFYDYESKEFSHKLKDGFKSEVTNKIDKSLYELLFEKNDKIFSFVAKLERDRIYKENENYYINECKGFLHKKYKHYDEYDDKIKSRVQMILNMIKEIACSNNEELFTAYIKYFGQLARGIKTQVIIYNKSEQGTGKSTISDFIMKYVLGNPICLISGTEPLLTNINKILLGKLLVVFEELPYFTTKEWEGVSSKMKTFTTETKMVYRGLFKDPVECENISNIFINSNVEAIKDSDGRRIVIMPISSIRKGDYTFFSNIRNNCFNLECGEAFYSYLMTIINVDGFYAQQHFPETESKLLAISNRLHPIYKFIKFDYILKSQKIEKQKPQEFYDCYMVYCKIDNQRICNKNDFIKKLEEIKIMRRKVNGLHYYNETLETLNGIAEKNKWICDYDEKEEKKENKVRSPFLEDDDVLDTGINYKYKCSMLEAELAHIKSTYMLN